MHRRRTFWVESETTFRCRHIIEPIKTRCKDAQPRYTSLFNKPRLFPWNVEVYSFRLFLQETSRSNLLWQISNSNVLELQSDSWINLNIDMLIPFEHRSPIWPPYIEVMIEIHQTYASISLYRFLILFSIFKLFQRFNYIEFQIIVNDTLFLALTAKPKFQNGGRTSTTKHRELFQKHVFKFEFIETISRGFWKKRL